MTQQYTTANGITVIAPKAAQQHLEAHPETKGILAEAIGKISIASPATNNGMQTIEVDMGRIMGRSGRIATPAILPSQETLFAHRVGRSGPSRIAIESQGEETSVVSICVFPSHEDATVYVLATAWVGTASQKEPWDPYFRIDRKACLEYWCEHALVYDASIMGAPFTSTWDDVLFGMNISIT